MSLAPTHIGFSVQSSSPVANEAWSEAGFYLTADVAIARLRELPTSDGKRLVAITRILSTPGFKPNRATLLWEGKRVPRWLGASQDVGAENFSTENLKIGA